MWLEDSVWSISVLGWVSFSDSSPFNLLQSFLTVLWSITATICSAASIWHANHWDQWTIHKPNSWTRQTQQLISRSSLLLCLMCQVKKRCTCYVSYALKWSFNSFYLSHLVAFHRQGIGCPKQEKVLTCKHTTLCHHAAAMHAVLFFFIIHFSAFSL